MTNAIRHLVVGLVSAGIALLIQATPGIAFTDEQLAKSFRKTVFGAEYSSFGWQSNMVKKYTKPVRVYIDNRSKIDRRSQVSRFVRSLPRSIRGLDVAIVDSPAKANYRIYIVDKARYKETVRKDVYGKRVMSVPGRCLVRVVSGPAGIKRSDAVIVADDGDFLFKRCLVEEVLQGLGPVNDNPGLTHSVFNDNSRHVSFTKHDRYIMNMLYNPKIKAGMSENDVKTLLPAVIRDA
ncbi:MAG TPA: DUF2927 domain-containing protein, partial [Afifellaceae bacterium]|nr:DUF2927 domain-containing protein [Afifellaceae bacterium]